MKISDMYQSPERMNNLRQMLDASLREYSSKKHPLYGGIFAHQVSDVAGSDLNRLYVILGTDPACSGPEWPQGLDPIKTVRSQASNPQLFHTDMYVRDMTGINDELNVNGELVNWLSTSEMLHRLYAKYGAPIPATIHLQELAYLTEMDATIREPSTPPGARAELEKKLKKFFDVEKSHGLRKSWREFVRSDKCPVTKGFLARVRAYFKRHSNIVPMEQLWHSTDSMQELVMAERDYQRFADVIRKEHPEVTYAIGEKIVRNEGLDKKSGPTVQPGVRRISDDEYAAIKRERFAKEGWNCLVDVKPAKFETRSVYYKEADAGVVAGVYQNIAYEFAKADPMRDIQSWGQCSIIDVAEADFDNFVSMAKVNHIPFAIDTQGTVKTPVMGEVHVMYPTYYAPWVLGCLECIVNNTIAQAHSEKWRNEVAVEPGVELRRAADSMPIMPTVTKEPMPALDIQIQKAQDTVAEQMEASKKKQLPNKKRPISIDDIQL